LRLERAALLLKPSRSLHGPRDGWERDWGRAKRRWFRLQRGIRTGSLPL